MRARLLATIKWVCCAPGACVCEGRLLPVSLAYCICFPPRLDCTATALTLISWLSERSSRTCQAPTVVNAKVVNGTLAVSFQVYVTLYPSVVGFVVSGSLYSLNLEFSLLQSKVAGE